MSKSAKLEYNPSMIAFSDSVYKIRISSTSRMLSNGDLSVFHLHNRRCQAGAPLMHEQLDLSLHAFPVTNPLQHETTGTD
jgi:hypothetical protein